MTTDPVPEPAARLLAGDDDPYWVGWLLTTINFSDLAAAGAEAIAFLAAIEAPSSMSVSLFERLVQGVADGCHKYGALYAGGNLRESQKITATGTAIGTCRSGAPVSRRGAQPGDLIVSIGQGGIFWRDVYRLSTSGAIERPETSPLFRPVAKVGAMSCLRGHDLVHAAIDNSDGLLPSLSQLAEASSVSIEIEVEALVVPGLETSMGSSGQRFWLGWGDWNVIAAIPASALPEVVRLAAAEGETTVRIGRVAAGPPGVALIGQHETLPAPRLESERFSRDSWFAAGIHAYWEALMQVRIPS